MVTSARERSPAWTMTAVALMGAVGVAIGLWLLLAPIGYVGRASCGSVASPRLPANDPVTVISCRNLRASHRDGGWLFTSVGIAVGVAAGGRAALYRRRTGEPGGRPITG